MTRICSIFLLMLLMLPVGSGENFAKSKAPGKTTWQESGSWKLSVHGAIGKMRGKMIREGFREKHEIQLDKKGHRFLYLWENGSRKVIFMLWSITVDTTGYSWGEYHDRK